MHRIIFRIGVALCAALPAAGVLAQTYPSQPIKLVVPYTPGTGMDIIARTVGPKLSERLGQPVIVENKLIASNLYRSVPFNPLSDFAPISLAAWGTLLLTANPNKNIKSLADLIARAKANPGKLTYSSPGVGTPHHMSMELLKDLTGVSLLHVPYKGSAGALTDLISGEIDVAFVPIHVAMPYVQAGRLTALAVGSAKRQPNAPGIPTLQELGVKGADVDMWYAFMAPKGTPATVVSRLDAELRAILALPEIKAGFDKQGMDAASSSPEELNALMRRDNARWAAIIRKNNITAE